MLVVGDRESGNGTVSVRTRRGGDKGASPVDAFIASARDEIAPQATECALARHLAIVRRPYRFRQKSPP